MANIRGLDQFIRSVQTISNDMESSVKQVVTNTALQIESDAKYLAPVDTGHTRRNITTEVKDGGMAAEVYANAEYSIYVEFGTSKQNAQPFMTPAFVQNKEKFQRDIIAAMRGLRL